MPCIALLGGTFDPVHCGHVALADYFVRLLKPDVLRIIPAGNPWQKVRELAPAADRIEMATRAFAKQPVPVTIDSQEISRAGASYTIDTLRKIRAEVGPDVSLAFLLGADQLQQLDSWHEWERLFDYANLCAASRPGFAMDEAHVPQKVLHAFAQRAATPALIRSRPSGLALFAAELAVDVSSTAIRIALQHGQSPTALLPPAVLDYIQHHHLYQN
jgi:nicotinate-nucleotide adenylyltransferase